MPASPEQDFWVLRVLGARLALAREIAAVAASPEVVAAAGQIRDGALRAEPAVTAALGREVTTQGGQLLGIEHRLKTPESLGRKIATDMVKAGLDADQAAGGISDALRFTACFPAESYAAGTRAVLAALAAIGIVVHRLKNAWTQNIPYKGINVQLIGPEGQAMELQFHTAESFAAKETGTHAIYERMRLTPRGSPEWLALDRAQRAVFDAVPRPPDVERIEGV